MIADLQQRVGRVAFRVDASARIGTGHLMRCLTLADTLATLGARCQFISVGLAPGPVKLIRRRGHEHVALPTGSPDGCFSDAEIRNDVLATIAVLDRQPADWLAVDHYGIDRKWEQEFRGRPVRLMIIDDLADREHTCDLLLDQTPTRDPRDYWDLVPGDCRILAGGDYALLRPEFSLLSARARAKRSGFRRVKTVLVNFGGADPKELSLPAVSALLAQSPDQIVLLVLGGLAKQSRIAECFVGHDRVRVFVDTPNLAALMLEADLALGGVGTSAWERCALGLPSIVFPYVENQRESAGIIADRNAGLVLEHLSSGSHGEIQRAIGCIERDYHAFSDACFSLVGTDGPHKVAAALSA